MTQKDLKKETEAITQYIQYSVKEKDAKQALSFLEEHKKNPVILTLLKEFYSALPEGIEEPVIRVVNVRCRMDAYLVAVSTSGHDYLYFVDLDRAVFLCTLGESIDNQDILDFFDYRNGDELIRECQKVQGSVGSSTPDVRDSSACLVCYAEDGEFHEFGCPVEVCPWCDGQLTKCNCRFDKLGVTEIVDEEQLLTFFELLSEKGRIPFKKEHGVSYPSDSRGIVCD